MVWMVCDGLVMVCDGLGPVTGPKYYNESSWSLYPKQKMQPQSKNLFHIFFVAPVQVWATNCLGFCFLAGVIISSLGLKLFPYTPNKNTKWQAPTKHLSGSYQAPMRFLLGSYQAPITSYQAPISFLLPPTRLPLGSYYPLLGSYQAPITPYQVPTRLLLGSCQAPARLLLPPTRLLLGSCRAPTRLLQGCMGLGLGLGLEPGVWNLESGTWSLEPSPPLQDPNATPQTSFSNHKIYFKIPKNSVLTSFF